MPVGSMTSQVKPAMPYHRTEQPSMEVPMPHATVNGARLWYDMRGRSRTNAAPIVLHHGYTASRVNWLPVAARLVDRHRVVLIECRGTGESEHTADGYTLEQYAADVVALADHLDIERFTFAGHSMGGGIGYRLALDYGERLEKLILMASIPADGFPNADPHMHALRATLRKNRDRAALLAQYRAGCVRPDAEDDVWFESRVDHVIGVSDGHFDGGADAMRTLAVGARLASIATPTLVIAGSADGLLDANLEDFKRLPNAALEVFSRAGHDIALHEPDGVARAIDAFVRYGLARPRGEA
jgi:pimeloyl-ACP methyl ester carboxylesterase